MRDQVTSARSTELLDRSVRNKRVLLVSAAFGYVMFFMAGTDTGLGVLVRNPELCLAAAGCALVATFWSSKKQRWICGIATAVAIAGTLYGYHENSKWRAKLDRFEDTRPQPPASQTEMDR